MLKLDHLVINTRFDTDAAQRTFEQLGFTVTPRGYHTLGSLSIPLHVIGWNAKMLRDQAVNNMDYYTNSITIGGGESMDALLDACAVRGPAPTYGCTTPVPVGTYFIYTPNLDHLSNDAENFGGLMTEVVVTP